MRKRILQTAQIDADVLDEIEVWFNSLPQVERRSVMIAWLVERYLQVAYPLVMRRYSLKEKGEKRGDEEGSAAQKAPQPLTSTERGKLARQKPEKQPRTLGKTDTKATAAGSETP